MITIQEIRQYCLRKPGKIVEDFPFDEDTLVIKVRNKMFLLTSLTSAPPALNLKCDPDLAVELRERFAAVRPGYHMNKKHWNTVVLDGSLPVAEVIRMIDHSFDQVMKGFSAGRKTVGTKRGAKLSNKKGRTRRPRSRK